MSAAYFNLKIILEKEGLGNFPKIEKSLTDFEVSSIQKTGLTGQTICLQKKSLALPALKVKN
ncbi:hypothetical protein DW196_10870 [Vagococcus sp. AM17-17]|nr:hypothetical protein DW196_10870 [Vagococcus sp. AM17-17]